MSIPIRRAVHYAIVVAAATAAMSSQAQAQQRSGANNQAADDITEVIVTGSRIRRTEAESASPVQAVARQEIERTGAQNIADVLRSIVSADNQGSIPSAFSQGFATGSSAISLRGLGVNSTLVLVNGRRMATYGLADDGSRTFVDLNSIPLDAVERVEVLKDGGSALYGSDAVGGVVNIILRESYQGATFGGNVGTSYKDDGDVYRLAGTFGFGDLESDRFNVFATVEGSRSGAINQSNRPELGGTNLTHRGYFDNRLGAVNAGLGAGVDGNPAFSTSTPYGSVKTVPSDPSDPRRTNILPCPEISPQTGMCLFDDIDYVEVQPEQERLNIFTRGTFRVTEATQAYAELGWFHSYTKAVGTPGGINDSGVFNPSDPANPVTPPHRPVMPANHPDNPLGIENNSVRLLTTMFGGRNAEVNSDVARAIVGWKGDLNDKWTFDVGAGYIESNLYRTQTGLVRFPVLQEALNNGTFRFDPSLMSRELMNAISPELRDHGKNSVTLVDATISGELFDLPGGAFGIAVGTEYRNEKANKPPVPFTDTSEIVGLGYSAFKADRDIYAGYVELNAPVAPGLELDGAFRYDHYSDYGHSTTPKFGVKWSPIDMLALRATYSEAFRAPGPTESGNSSSLGFTNIAIVSVGDPSVKPETAKSYTAGFVLEPTSSTSVSLDYFKIDRDNEITQADQATIVGGAPLSITPTGDTVRVPGAMPNSFLYYDEFGDLATISGPYMNLAQTKTDGLDLDFRQKFDLAELGALDIGLVWTYIFNYEKTNPDGTKLEYVGTHGPYALSSAGGTPRNRGSLELSWSRDALGLTARVNYVSSMRMIDHQGETLVDGGDGTFFTTTGEGAYFNVDPNGIVCGVYNPDGSAPNGCKVDSFTTVDLYGVYRGSENWQLDLSVTNLLGKVAPFDPYTYGGRNYNPSFHQAGAVGRFITAGFKYSF